MTAIVGIVYKDGITIGADKMRIILDKESKIINRINVKKLFKYKNSIFAFAGLVVKKEYDGQEEFKKALCKNQNLNYLNVEYKKIYYNLLLNTSIDQKYRKIEVLFANKKGLFIFKNGQNAKKVKKYFMAFSYFYEINYKVKSELNKIEARKLCLNILNKASIDYPDYISKDFLIKSIRF